MNIFDTGLTADHLNQELVDLAYTGKATGEMAETFGERPERSRRQIKTLDSDVAQVTDTVFGFLPGDTSVEEFTKNIDDLDVQLAALVKSGNADLAAKVFEEIKDAAEAEGVSVEKVTDLFNDYTKEVDKAAEATGSIAGKTAEEIKATEQAALSLQAYRQRTVAFNEEIATLTSATGPSSTSSPPWTTGWSRGSARSTTTRGRSTTWPRGSREVSPSHRAWSRDAPTGPTLVTVAEAGLRAGQAGLAAGRAAAAMTVYRSQRQTLFGILTTAGITGRRAWKMINRVFKEPIEIKLDLKRAEKNRIQKDLRGLFRERAQIIAEANLPPEGSPGFKAAWHRLQTSLEPIDAQIAAKTKNLRGVNRELRQLANPNGEGLGRPDPPDRRQEQPADLQPDHEEPDQGPDGERPDQSAAGSAWHPGAGSVRCPGPGSCTPGRDAHRGAGAAGRTSSADRRSLLLGCADRCRRCSRRALGTGPAGTQDDADPGDPRRQRDRRPHGAEGRTPGRDRIGSEASLMVIGINILQHDLERLLGQGAAHRPHRRDRATTCSGCNSGAPARTTPAPGSTSGSCPTGAVSGSDGRASGRLGGPVRHLQSSATSRRPKRPFSYFVCASSAGRPS